MIGYLSGKVQLIHENNIIIDVNGVGYKVSIGPDFLAKLHIDENADMYIYTHVREDILALYGFENAEELDFFELLIGVSGIGPKAALGILAVAPMEKIRSSIVNQDPTLLSSVSGIGKKTAEKVVIELKNKVGATGSIFANQGDKAEDVYGALLQLGFKPHEASTAVAELPDECKTTEERLKYCLSKLNKG
ncbi:MAG: Holliday junction branch migration protein RuvA [Patescibacteria group bacterium]|jgi:Holliday junction DNA helicase RuvA|nr:Holliday junction branch migration protein RuvA [Patescibacteria group bacterium]